MYLKLCLPYVTVLHLGKEKSSVFLRLYLPYLSDVNNSSSSPSESPTEWFAAKVNGYYKNNLKIGHLNINSIFGKSDEVVNLLDKCAFDILFISESKTDGSVSSTLFAHAEYRIIRKDRKKGGGGLLVYIRSNVTAHRQIKLEPDGKESICLDVKGCANNWFLICACYRSPGKCKITEFIPACASMDQPRYPDANSQTQAPLQKISSYTNRLKLVQLQSRKEQSYSFKEKGSERFLHQCRHNKIMSRSILEKNETTSSK